MLLRVSPGILLLFLFLFTIPHLARGVTGNLNFSATVPARPIDLQSELSLTQPGNAVFPQETALTYEITYGSSLPYTVNELTVEASWDLGTVDGSSNPSVSILDYSIGTATNGFNGVQPTIDITNRKITWRILQFPANTKDQKVSFIVKTNSSYTGASSVSVPVHAVVSGIGTSQKSTITNVYRYKKAGSESPTSTPVPTETTNPTQTPAPTETISTPSPTQVRSPRLPLQITTIDIPEIAEDTAKVSITTSRRTKIQLSYGIAPDSLGETISDTNLSRAHSLILPTLTPATTYYFTVIATNQTGETVRSDIFTLNTAKISDVPIINSQSIILKSDNLVLTNTATTQAEGKKDTTAVIPTQTGFDFQFSINRYKDVKRVQAFVRNKFVLGLSSFVPEAEASTETTELTEIAPGVYTGKLLANATPGNYEIFIRIEDNNGNVKEEKVGEVRVVPRLTVLEKNSKNPIENARLLYSLYNERRHTYERISPIALSLENPTFTRADGQATTVLPAGRYLVRVTAIGYQTQDVKFTIGTQKGQEFPVILLEKAPFNIFQSIKYYLTILLDVFEATKAYVLTLSSSFRLIGFLSFLTVVALVLLTILSYSIKIQVPIHRIPHHFFSHFRESKSQREKQTPLSGRILDTETDKGLSDVELYLIDQQTRLVMNRTKTNGSGEFRLMRLPGRSYTLRIFKLGYHLLIKPIDEDENNVLLSLSIHNGSRLSSAQLVWYTKAILSSLFEALLVFSLLFELTAGYVLGLQHVRIFLFLSLINLALWLHYRKHLRMHQV